MHELFHQFFTYTDSHELDCDVNSRQSSVIRFFFPRTSLFLHDFFLFSISYLIKFSQYFHSNCVFYTFIPFASSWAEKPKSDNRIKFIFSSLFSLLHVLGFVSVESEVFFICFNSFLFLFLGSDQRQKPTHLHEIHGWTETKEKK